MVVKEITLQVMVSKEITARQRFGNKQLKTSIVSFLNFALVALFLPALISCHVCLNVSKSHSLLTPEDQVREGTHGRH